MSKQNEQRRVKARKTCDGWQIDLDSQSWADIMTALTIAADASEPDEARLYRALRTALSTAEQEKRCSRCGKRASECLALGLILGPIATNGQCRVCNGQMGLGVEYEGLAIDLYGNQRRAS